MQTLIQKLFELIHILCRSCRQKYYKRSCYSSNGLLLIHLPTEVLSKIIIQLLNECTEIRSYKFYYSRGLLDRTELMPHVIARHITPLSQVNKLFNHLVWSLVFERSCYIPGMNLIDGDILVFLKTRTTPFVYTESILQSRGLESSTQLYMVGHICKKYYKYVQHLVLYCPTTFIKSAAYELHKPWKFPKIPLLKTLFITTEFIRYVGSQYNLKITKTVNHKMIFGKGITSTAEANLPPFVQTILEQPKTDATVVKTQITAYYGQLASNAIAKMISRLGHPVDCTVCFAFRSREKGRHEIDDCIALRCLLWAFNDHKIINQIQRLDINKPIDIVCNKCVEFLRLVDLKYLIFSNCLYGNTATDEIKLLLTENPRLRQVRLEGRNTMSFEFPQNLEMLTTGSNSIFLQYRPLLRHRFACLVELVLDFQTQISRIYIYNKFLFIPTLQTVTVSGKIIENMTLITCFLESNIQITTVSVYYRGDYENIGPLYKSMCNVKVLNAAHSTYLTNSHARKLNLESMLDVIFQNSSSLEMIMIPKSIPTNPIDFTKLTTQICQKYKENTRNLKYLNIYTNSLRCKRRKVKDLVAIFFKTQAAETSTMSPYNPKVKKLYRIDCIKVKDKLDAGRCRLELDVSGLKRLLYEFK